MQLKSDKPLRIACVLSGGQAPGGHNVISGIFDMARAINPESKIYGFLNGPKGVFTGNYQEITNEYMDLYRNTGGFDMICSGRDKIETEQQKADSAKFCTELQLDGLIVIGGDDSNTNACVLAEYFKEKKVHTSVIGCPKTIDGDLKNEHIEVSFGFDTATKVYNELIGNICIDARSSKKYYHFIRLMGRSASHIALECQLQSRTNLVLIGEEISRDKQSLAQITNNLADVITERAKRNKDYGVFLVPEGLIEFIPEMNSLISQINDILAHAGDAIADKTLPEIKAYVGGQLKDNEKTLFEYLPHSIADQLLLDRDPHGNVQVAKIETEKLLILMLQTELEKRRTAGQYKGTFNP